MTTQEIEARAEEMFHNFMKGLAIGVVVGGGFMTIVGMIAFLVVLRFKG